MPLILFLAGVLLDLAKPLVGRVLLALGFSYLTYAGTTVALNWFEDLVKSQLQGLGSVAINFLSFCGVDSCITIIFSGMVTALAIKGLSQGGNLTKLVVKS